ncbi:hypothetical protein OIV83_002462 [Microbotryomycetes sp. JL201]|nr:hypothetical protein OIV83_002462 [Microbotryomycetes sp. JL201]
MLGARNPARQMLLRTNKQHRPLPSSSQTRTIHISTSRLRTGALEPLRQTKSVITLADCEEAGFRLFRKTDPKQIILYMYRNSPSVIIGRNQNPWKEVNLHRLADLGIPIVRRKSGGGTVYHDLGNTNYCVFVPRTGFERRTNAVMVAEALNTLEINAYVNDRNDICVDKFKMTFKLVNARAYHHGTMLIDAKLSDLRGVLGTQKATLITKGVASVSSPVRNLVEWKSSINHDEFVKAVSNQFAKQQGLADALSIQAGYTQRQLRVDEEEAGRNDYVAKVMDELDSWGYKWGSTPEFTHDIKGKLPFGSLAVRIHSKGAIITGVELLEPPKQIEWRQVVEELVDMLEGDHYGTLDGMDAALRGLNGFKAQRMKTIVEWLKDEM